MPERKSKLPVNPTQKEQSRYNAVLLEEVRSQMKAVIETVEVSNSQLNEKIDGVEQRLTDRIEVVEMVVKKNSGDIQSIKGNIQSINGDIQSIHKKLTGHDQRFDRLEQKMDRIADKVERHDEAITDLKSAVSQT